MTDYVTKQGQESYQQFNEVCMEEVPVDINSMQKYQLDSEERLNKTTFKNPFIMTFWQYNSLYGCEKTIGVLLGDFHS